MPDRGHPALQLWQRQHDVAPYPPGVAAVGERIAGTGFFPGAAGLWQDTPASPLPDFPVEGVMVLGHNFDSEAGYRRSLARGQENLGGPTWKNLIDVLARADVPLERCFFTNVYVGLIAGDRATGAFPGRRDAAYVQRCLDFLRVQLSTQRPRAILALGRHVLPLLARLSPALNSWQTVTSFRDVDAAEGAMIPDVAFPHDPSWRTTVVALTHPCLRRSNVRRRIVGEHTGDAAEQWLIREAMRTTSEP